MSQATLILDTALSGNESPPTLGPGTVPTGFQLSNGQVVAFTDSNQLSQTVDIGVTSTATPVIVIGTSTSTQTVATVTAPAATTSLEPSSTPEVSSGPPLGTILPAIIVPIWIVVSAVLYLWYRRRKESRKTPKPLPELPVNSTAGSRKSFWSFLSRAELPGDGMRPELDGEHWRQELEGDNTRGQELHGQSRDTDSVSKKASLSHGSGKHEGERLKDGQKSPASRSMFTTVAIWPLSRARSEASMRIPETENEKA